MPLTFLRSGNNGVTDSKNRDGAKDAKLKELVTYLNGTKRNIILYAKDTGAYMNV